MTTKRLSGLVAAACMLLLFSCGKKTSSYTKYIPKDANYVVGVDVKSIIQKLDKDSLSVENMMTTFKIFIVLKVCFGRPREVIYRTCYTRCYVISVHK